MHGQVLYIALLIYFDTNLFVKYNYIISLVILKYITESLTTWQAWSKVNVGGRMYNHGLILVEMHHKDLVFVGFEISQLCTSPFGSDSAKLKIAATTSNTY